MLDITVIILTYNEELHIRRCLENCIKFSKKIYIVDSPSNDRTADIVSSFKSQVSGETSIELVVHKYPGNQAEQFNWAIDNLQIDTEWVLRLDADEYLTPELITEMSEKLPTLPQETSAVVLPLGRAFMGRILKHGIVNGISMIRLFRRGKARYEARVMDEHLQVLEGDTVTFVHKFVDDNRLPLSKFKEKHRNYARREAAIQLLQGAYPQSLPKGKEERTSANGQLAEVVQAKRAQKDKYAKMPLFLRAVAYFCYRYFFKLGFLDGKEGFYWDFYQGLWYRWLVDKNILECKRACGKDKEKIKKYISRNWKISIKRERGERE